MMSNNDSNSDDEEYKSASRRLKAFVEGEMKKVKDILEKKTWNLQKGIQESEEILSLNVAKI